MESRLTELEVKLAFQDDLLDALNLTVSRQQQQIDLLQQQLRVLYQQMRSNGSGSDDSASGHEIPPHY
jgi:SlyX protein